MATVNLKHTMRRILWVVGLDVVVISVLSLLTVGHMAPLYPTALIVYPTLFVINLVIIWRAFRQRNSASATSIRIPRLAWLGLAAFTIGCVVQIVYWIREPDIPSTAQAIVGILLAGFAWFLVYRVTRYNKDRTRPQ